MSTIKAADHKPKRTPRTDFLTTYSYLIQIVHLNINTLTNTTLNKVYVILVNKML